MKKIIPLVEPPITTYPAIANILSLKWGKNKSSNAWFMDHFIQLVVRPNHEHTFGDFYDHADLDNFYRIIYGLPGLGWMRVNKGVAGFDKFSDFIEHEIDNDYCVEACVDRYYFKFLEKKYRKNHYIHSSMIYGYDDNEKTVNIADFFIDGKYESKVISYDEINASMNNDWLINLYRDEYAEYEFNEKLMKKYLEDYIYSRDSFNKFAFSNKKYNEGVIFGVAYYDYLIDCLHKENGKDYRMYHILYDHKQLMKKRLEYLINLKKYDCEKIALLLCENENLIRESKVLRAYFLKYCLNQSTQVMDKIKDRVISLKEKDISFVKSFIDIISE